MRWGQVREVSWRVREEVMESEVVVVVVGEGRGHSGRGGIAD